MSVLLATKIFVTPVLRRPDDTVRRKIFARWTGITTVTGNGSGGNVQIVMVFDTRGQYPPGLLWTVQWLRGYMSVYAAGTWIVTIAPYEYSASGNALSSEVWANPVQNGSAGYFVFGSADWTNLTFPYRFPDIAVNEATLVCDAGVNVNGTFYTIRGGGYLLHEDQMD